MTTTFTFSHVRSIAIATLMSASAVTTFAASDPADDFIIAVRNDNVGAVTRLLDGGLDPNVRNAKGQTGLTVAMQEGSTRSVRLLLARRGIDIDELNNAGESPLMMAALKGNLDGAKLLVAQGAKVNQPGWSALHYAATGSEPKVVGWLLDNGAAIDAPSPNGTTPLMMAAQYGSEDNLKLLLERGADVGRRNQQDQQAIDFARRSGRDSVVRRVQAAMR